MIANSAPASARFLLHVSDDPNEQLRNVVSLLRRDDSGMDRPESVTLYTRRPDDPTDADPRAGVTPPNAVVGCYMEDSYRVASTLSAVDAIDRASSGVVAGLPYLPSPHGLMRSVMLMLALRRPETMSLDECHDYWLNTHAPLATSILAGGGYEQHHAEHGDQRRIADHGGFGVADFDGLAVTTFPSYDEFISLMSDPELAGEALADERNFVDHGRSAMGVYNDSTPFPRERA